MHRRSLSLVWLACLAAVSLALAGCGPRNGGSSAGAGPSVYNRVVNSGVIRCGYVTYPPGCVKDSKTGKLSGVCVEVLEEAAKNLGLRVEWKEEVGWGSMIEGLEADRYDMIGSQVWPTSARGKVCDFTRPLFYSVLAVYVRSDENRFTGRIDSINSPAVKVATIDGEISDVVAKARFPRAQRVSLPQLSDVSQVLLNVSQRKADVAFVEPYLAEGFLKSNPGTVKNITVADPVYASSNVMMLRRGQQEFKSMLNTALDELVNTGFVDKTLDKYDPAKSFYRLAKPYRVPERTGAATGTR